MDINILNSNEMILWFDHLEKNLETEAEQAGLLEHGSMIGSAREFLLRRVLKTILPPIVHIGTGRIIDGIGNQSKQIDLILYDSRFPILEIDKGFGKYLLEGVIATIEVKSTLNANELKKALDNCHSVMKMSIVLNNRLPKLKEDSIKKNHCCPVNFYL